MTTTSKVLVPNKAWILQNQGTKIGTLNKEKKGYAFFKNGEKLELNNLSEVKDKFGTDIVKDAINNVKHTEQSKSMHSHHKSYNYRGS